MGGLSRRFLNVIVDNRAAGVQTLRCIDLLPRHKLLFNAKPPTKPAKKKKMVPLASPPRPSPRSGMRASTTSHMLHCCAAAAPGDRAALCLDGRSGRTVLLEAADTSRLVMTPWLHQPKLDPISLYLPDSAAGAGLEWPTTDSCELLHGNRTFDPSAETFFIMDRIVRPKEGEELEAAASCQPFEALVCRYHHPYPYPRTSSPAKYWECDVIPPPPPYMDSTSSLEITSHAVISDNTICISIDGVGTYCLKKCVGTDYCYKATYQWSEVGTWTLPFRGKVEYVPGLNLWFGFSSEDGHFAAADLSTMNMEDSQSQQPQLLGSWKELEPPQGWQQVEDPQLVSLGSGRFCIARFFHTVAGAGTGIGSGDESIPCSQNNATVLTGVEVTVHGVNEQVSLGMVKHKSRSHRSRYGEDTIVSVL